MPAPAESDQPKKVFPGFSNPRYTQVPDAIFDELLPDLSEAELKVLLYIVRRTFGFKKESDTISLKQLSNGITKRDGEVLDRGTGLSKAGVTKALASLRAKGILVRTINVDPERGNTPTTYRLRMLGDPIDIVDTATLVRKADSQAVSTTEDTLVHDENLPLSTDADTLDHSDLLPESTTVAKALSTSDDTGLSAWVDTQDTVIQETVKTDGPFEFSNGQPSFSQIMLRAKLEHYVEDIAVEFNDESRFSSTLTRAVRLCEQSGLDADQFVDVMMAARQTVKRRSASITKEVSSDESGWARKNRIPYFFAVVQDMLGFRPERAPQEILDDLQAE